MARILRSTRERGKVIPPGRGQPDEECLRLRRLALQLQLEAARRRDLALAEAEAQVTELGILVAEHLLQRTLELQPEAIADVVTPLLRRVRDANRLELRVNPEDARTLQTAGLPGLDIVPDPELRRGGCLLLSDRGRLDARLELRLEAVAEALGVAAP